LKETNHDDVLRCGVRGLGAVGRVIGLSIEYLDVEDFHDLILRQNDVHKVLACLLLILVSVEIDWQVNSGDIALVVIQNVANLCSPL